MDSPVPATGHTYTASVVPDTCTTKGYTLYTCACGDSYQDGAPGHTFTTLVVEPTETVNGFTLHECECGYRYESDPVVSLGSPDADVIYDVKEYDYIYNGSSLTQLVITTTNYGDGPVVETLYFAYDGSSPMTVTYNGDVFYYVTNLQGDVVAILDDEGYAVVEYAYDAWGNILTTTGSMASTLGVANPFTYRGYVYDTESGLYYLQSRYYNPKVGRFINADAFASTGQGFLGNNMFAYCLNSPLNYTDSAGKNAIAEGLKNGLWVIPLLDGPLPYGEIIALIALVGIAFYELSEESYSIPYISSQTINWNINDNNKNHILKGTERKHVNGWKRFGIDPDNNNAWGLLLPLLKEVVDKADYSTPTTLPDGAMYIQYFKTYIEQGVQVMVKIWIDVTGTIQQISDAIPYIID